MTGTDLVESTDAAWALIAEARRDFRIQTDDDLIGALAVLGAEARLEIKRLRAMLFDVPLPQPPSRRRAAEG
jgi:hypothetical protein